MSYNISEEPYEKTGGEDSGGDSLNFTPEHHHVSSVDTPTAHDPAGAKEEAREVREADSEEAASARKGASWAIEGGSLKGDSLAFTVSDGMHSVGADHRDCFEQALRDSGGVRQGSTWTSDPASGVARVVCEHTITLEQLHKQDDGSGRTFETQRRSRWSHDQWG